MKRKILKIFICIVGLAVLCSAFSVVFSEPPLESDSSEQALLTMPPVERLDLRPHPRLYLSEDSLPSLRSKLENEAYADDVRWLKNSRNPTDQAFNYLVWGDENAGQNAKKALLSGVIPRWGRMEKTINTFQAALMFDWLYLLLTPSERLRAIAVVKSTFSQKPHKDGIQYYWNDMWARGPAYNTVAALSLAGDDDWADRYMVKAYHKPREAFSPYGGGAIDTLNSIALDSGGGHQAGTYGKTGSNYEAMFLLGAGPFLTAWQSATNENVLSKTTFFERLPYYFTYGYLHETSMSEQAKQTLEYITAIGSNESASLAMWLLGKYGRAKNALVMRLILGDLTNVIARSPEELELPKATYLAGADLVVSRTGWSDNDTAVYMFARHWDTSRYEPYSGIISIYKGGEPLLVRGIKGKQSFNIINNSGMWIWDEKDQKGSLGQGSTYWQSLKNRSRRALSAAVVFDQRNTYYRPGTLSDFSVKNGLVTATTRYEQLLKYEDVELAERTLIHDTIFNTVKITDHLKVSPKARVAWSLRLAEEPVIVGNTISVSGMKITLASPAANIYWVGGEGRELIGPDGNWHGDGKHGYVEGYSKDKARAKRYGAGYVFAESFDKSDEYKFSATIEIQ